MYCPECREELPDDAKFCIKCGYDFARITTPPERKAGDSLDLGVTEVAPEIAGGAFEAGMLFANRYEILDKGIAGGMGTVYKCRQTNTGKTYALKVIHPRLISSKTALSRFHQEVAISQDLMHPNIVRVFSLEEHDGIEFFTMEWIEGVTLREVIEERKKENRPFSLEEVNIVIGQLAGALEYAHKYTVHRDIKPENLLIEGDRSQESEVSERLRIKLTDFGIAKMLSPSEFTSTSIQMGTPYYMAPEQKVDAAKVDKRADVYACGVLLFEMLTLENTIGFELPSEINEELSAGVDELVKRSVATKPENRYDTAGQIADGLRAVIAEAEVVEEEEKKQAEQEAEELRIWEEEERQRKEEKERLKVERERQKKEQEKIKQEQEVSIKAAAQERKQAEARKREEAEQMLAQGKEAEKLSNEPEVGNVDITKAGQEVSSKKTNKMLRRSLVLIVLVVAGIFIYMLPVARLIDKRHIPSDPEMISVKGGCFQMGDQFGNWDSDEKPVHEVCVDDFNIGKYEITQGQWKSVMGNNPSHFSFFGDNNPVERISWDDVQTFINKLNGKNGKKYRLPTEAEWEYACRSGGKKERYCGGNDAGAVAWYGDNSTNATHPVGQKKANGLGIYDMSGNVYEWVSDWYGKDYYEKSPRNNPKGPSGGSSRVLRGGSWLSSERYVRSAYRFFYTPYDRYHGLGFRLARTK